MGRLTTHVLDTARGVPAGGMGFRLDRVEGAARRRVAGGVTNGNGRSDAPLLEGEGLVAGVYELTFAAGEYLRASGQAGGGILFLEEIPIRFGVGDPAAHYHVPLLISPFGYATYRGS